MTNTAIAEIFNTIADILDMQRVPWKPVAYRKAARIILTLGEELSDTYIKRGINGLKEIPGIGDALAHKIIEYITIGHIHEFEKLKASIPKGLYDLLRVPGLGPKKAWTLYTTLGIKDLSSLKKAAHTGKISTLPGFGKKSEHDILKGIGLVAQGNERQLLGVVLPLALHLVHVLRAHPAVQRAEIAGSLRRMKETIRDIDLLVVTDTPEKVMKHFTSLPLVTRILAQGPTKASVVLQEHINCDLRALPAPSFGAGLLYFSGSKDHNILLRNIAIKKGYKLNEYGLYKGTKPVAGATEQSIYTKLGLQYIPPELREDPASITLARTHTIPSLIPYNSIKGDLHVHTTWSDGAHSTEDMIRAAQQIGYQYVAITDHSKSLHVAHGLDTKRLLQHIEEIETLQKKFSITILTGSEVDILPDGSLDYDDTLLDKLDIVIASVHSRFKASPEAMTKRITTALENSHVTILGHPTGRLINKREPYLFDTDAVFAAAKKNKVAIEINSSPDRLDLKDSHVKLAVKKGVKLCINTDSHATDHFPFIMYGIAQARRGWATTRDVINTLPLAKLLHFIRKS